MHLLEQLHVRTPFLAMSRAGILRYALRQRGIRQFFGQYIAAALRDILANKALFRAEIADLKRQRRNIWAEKLALFSDEYPHL